MSKTASSCLTLIGPFAYTFCHLDADIIHSFPAHVAGKTNEIQALGVPHLIKNLDQSEMCQFID